MSETVDRADAWDALVKRYAKLRDAHIKIITQDDEITRLKAREKDLTLEGLSLIGRLEAIREVLAGTDIGCLPNDFSTEKMARDRMDEITRLKAEVERKDAALARIVGCNIAQTYQQAWNWCRHVAAEAYGPQQEKKA